MKFKTQIKKADFFQIYFLFYHLKNIPELLTILNLTLRRPLRKKIAAEVVFRRFQGEGVELF